MRVVGLEYHRIGKCFGRNASVGFKVEQAVGGRRRRLAGGKDSLAVKAETCEVCRTCTKIIYKEKAADANPFADDLASFVPNLLVGEAGWARAAVHPFLVSAD